VQWHLSNNGRDINVYPAWEKGYSGKGVVVTVVDDGIEYTHPDLADNYDAAASLDLNGNDNDPMPDVRYPINAHGKVFKWILLSTLDSAMLLGCIVGVIGCSHF
jgi:subtilisin family serine protease